jgi:hypothetical protein
MCLQGRHGSPVFYEYKTERVFAVDLDSVSNAAWLGP